MVGLSSVIQTHKHQFSNFFLLLTALVSELHDIHISGCIGIPAWKLFPEVRYAVGIAGLDEVDPVGVDVPGHIIINTGERSPHT